MPGTTTDATPVQAQLRPALGRQYAPDPRDRAFALDERRLRALVRLETGKAAKARTRPWHIRESLDQGATSECVVHALMHALQAAPRVHDLGWSRADRTTFYGLAQQRDGFPRPHDGTTARAVCSVARERGLISEYLWIYDEGTLREHLALRGTVMMGTDWFASMFATDTRGYVEPNGAVVGGHETLVRWYHGPRHRTHPDSYELQNSWGERWGVSGNFFLKADALRYLVFGLNGDLVLPTEAPVVRRSPA
jgi:hypothetical protein